MDPEVEKHFPRAQRVAYDRIVNDMHALQQRGATMASRLTTLATQLATVRSQLAGASNVSPAATAGFESLERDFEAVRVKFGVAAGRAPGAAAPTPPPGGPGGGGGGGGFGGGGAVNLTNALARLGQVKGLLVNVWETPSAGSMAQVTAATQALETAIREAEAAIGKVGGVNTALRPSGLSITMP
jgi:hypothetical protein